MRAQKLSDPHQPAERSYGFAPSGEGILRALRVWTAFSLTVLALVTASERFPVLKLSWDTPHSFMASLNMVLASANFSGGMFVGSFLLFERGSFFFLMASLIFGRA